MPRLARIVVHPIKSLDGVEVTEAALLPAGPLEFDRRWWLVDANGETINAKKTELAHQLRAHYDLAQLQVELECVPLARSATFSLASDLEKMGQWLSEHFGEPVQVMENATVANPDDPFSAGPTIISTASLTTVANWFSPALTLDETRRRFRANLEVDDTNAFWEDSLYGTEARLMRFRIGDVVLWGTYPCQRCVVPTRDSLSGEVTPLFAKDFSREREATLPNWVAVERFDHYFRLATNTRRPQESERATVRVGDPIEILTAISPEVGWG